MLLSLEIGRFEEALTVGLARVLYFQFPLSSWCIHGREVMIISTSHVRTGLPWVEGMFLGCVLGCVDALRWWDGFEPEENKLRAGFLLFLTLPCCASSVVSVLVTLHSQSMQNRRSNFAIWLDEHLSKGSSGSCDTFGNTTVLSSSEYFDVSVFALPSQFDIWPAC